MKFWKRQPRDLEKAATDAQRRADRALEDRAQTMRNVSRCLGLSVEEGTKALIEAFADIDKQS